MQTINRASMLLLLSSVSLLALLIEKNSFFRGKLCREARGALLVAVDLSLTVGGPVWAAAALPLAYDTAINECVDTVFCEYFFRALAAKGMWALGAPDDSLANVSTSMA